jgi:cytochrome P450
MAAPFQIPDPGHGRMPPGPAREFSLLDIRGDPLVFISQLAREFGEIVAYHAPGWSAVLLNSPDFVRHVLHENFRNYGKDHTPDLMMLKPMLGNGLLTSSGEAWRRQRQMLQPVFHARSIERFASIMTRNSHAMLDRWTAEGGAAEFELGDAMSDLTLRIAAECLFGYDVGADSGQFGEAVAALNVTMGHLDPADAGAKLEFHRALWIVRDTVLRIVKAGARAVNEDNALALMMRSMNVGPHSDPDVQEQIIDQVLTLLLAGHETTAKALAWTLYLLDREDAVLERVLAEIETGLGDGDPDAGSVERLPYLWAVIQEAMRLYPPIWLMSRMAEAADTIGGYRIAAGTLVVFSPYLLHRRPDLWPDPEVFRPERFLETSQDLPVPEFGYLPFSGGPRHCVGKAFARLEMRIVLPMILRRFAVRLRNGHPVEPQALVTLRPRHGLPVQLSPRHRARSVCAT